MSGQDLYIELQKKVHLLDKALRELPARGEKYANSECAYRVSLAKKILEERDKGTPVTIIGDVCRGDECIAKCKLERDIAQSLYDSAKEACNVYKLQVRLLENQIDREYRS